MRPAHLLALGLLVPALGGCGGGPKVVESRTVGRFDHIEVDGPAKLVVEIGTPPAVTVRAGEDVIDRVHTDVTDGVLAVGVDHKGIAIGPDPAHDNEIHVTVASLEGLSVEGSGNASIVGLRAGTFEARVKGSGSIDADGRAGLLDLEVDGSGDADLDGLEVRNAIVNADGSGSAEVFVTGTLDVEVEGSADVAYRGEPRVTSRVEGSGDLTAVGST
jgi:hypothetical protein